MGVFIIALLCLLAAWGVAALAGGGCGAVRPDARFLLISVTETDSGILRTAVVPGLAPAPTMAFDPERRELSVAHPDLAPRGRYRALVRLLVEDLSLPLDEALLPVRRLPWRYDLSRLVSGMERIDPSGRLARGSLVLVSLGEDAAATFEHLGRRFTLRPGESYGRLWVEVGGVVRDLEPGEEWRLAVEETLAGRARASRLMVTNHGWWLRSELQVR
ncbi:MAG: hypothetical protein ACYC6I_11950 [Bacillota bacterium]